MAIGFGRLSFDVEVLNLLPPDLPAVQGLKLYQRHFSDSRELIVTVSGENPAEVEAAAERVADRLRAETNLVANAWWRPPWTENPGASAELLAFSWLNQPPAEFAALADSLEPAALRARLADAREQLATSMSPGEIARTGYDPLGLTLLPGSSRDGAPGLNGEDPFVSEDGRFRLVMARANRALDDYRACKTWVSEMRGIVAEVTKTRANGEAAPDIRMSLTGRPAFVSEIAGGMETDMTLAVAATALIIAALFWFAHRRMKPLLWLLALLGVILASTLALGGLIYGAINVVSMGFAAILLGLAVDYAVVHYQEALAHPQLTIPEVRGAIAPSIFWAGLTTVVAFLMLNFGGLPGLGQLGTLVAVGVTLAAIVMIFEYLPPLFPERRGHKGQARTEPASPDAGGADRPAAPTRGDRPSPLQSALAAAGSGVLLVGSLIALTAGLPRLDTSADPLRPRASEAYSALAEIKHRINTGREPLQIIVSGENESAVARKLREIRPQLELALAGGAIEGFTLPDLAWPNPENQHANRDASRRLAGRRGEFHRIVESEGFSPAALGLADRVFDSWQAAAESGAMFWPTNPASRWVLDKVTARSETNLLAAGLVQAATNENRLLNLQLPAGTWLSGWELLGESIFGRVRRNFWKVTGPMVVLVLASLVLAFRRVTEVVLGLGVLALSGLVLLAWMRLAGWSWNLLNLMALPLLLGTGVDYGIFMQQALRRHHGNLHVAYRSVGRALLLCGGTAIAGFGSLAWSTNAGMASLGKVCAAGIALNMLISVFLLPRWWHWVHPPRAEAGRRASPGPDRPSSLYRAELWRAGLWIARALPRGTCLRLSRWGAGLYWRLAPHRRQVVRQNLLPALGHDEAKAAAVARRLVDRFAVKLVDLWRYESGLPIEDLFGRTSGWEHLEACLNKEHGVLLLTPHLGNWEFGGPWLARRGVPLHVITLAEPGKNLTQLRRQSRARWNIDTLVIRNDPFAFLEVIRKLEAGAVVALLIDRPPVPTAIDVTLFGRPFPASIAAAELARATGCTLLPVYLPSAGDGYEAHILPPVPYDRASLRDREARRHLTQEILRRFEPVISRHPDQWYHFVPIWNQATQ